MKKATKKTEMLETMQETLQTLPDDLKEMLVSKMPFPSILKASNLSKAWLARFSPISTLGDKDQKEFAMRFQKEVWTRFFQVSADKELCMTYNWACQIWVQMSPLSFLPKNITRGASLGGQANPGLVFVRDNGSNTKECLLVTNIFTHCWKWLPPCPTYSVGCRLSHSERVVRDSPTEPYKVITVSRTYGYGFVNVYNSKTMAWMTTMLPTNVIRASTYVYLNGVVYMETRPGVRGLFALNVEVGTSKILRLATTTHLHQLPID